MKYIKDNIWLFGCLGLIIMLILVLWIEAFAGTYYYPVGYNHPDVDSVYYLIAYDGTVRDSSMYTSFPFRDSISLNTDTAYAIKGAFFYNGETTPYESSYEPIPARRVNLPDHAEVRLKSFYVIDTANDTASFYVVNWGSSHAMSAVAYGSGAGFYNYSSSGTGLRVQSAGANPAFWVRNSSSGEGTKFESSSNDAFELYKSGSGAGHGWYVHVDDTSSTVKFVNTGTGNTFELIADSNGNALQIIAGGTDTTVHNYSIQTEGAVYMHGRDNRDESAVLMHSAHQGIPLYIWSDSSYGIRISTGQPNDTGVLIAGAFVVTDTFFADQVPQITATTDTVPIKALAQNNPDLFYGPTSTGSGSNAIRIYAIDTSGVDDSIMGVTITTRTMADVLDGNLGTNSFGYADFTMPTESLVILGRKYGYTWITDTIYANGADTIAIYGYNYPTPSPPSSPNMCTVWGYVRDNQGDSVNHAKLSFILPSGLVNICDTTTTVTRTIRTETDVHGYFEVPLVWSSCYDSTTSYKVWLKWQDEYGIEKYEKKEHKFLVPDSTTYHLVW